MLGLYNIYMLHGCYVGASVCLMCGLWSVICAVFSLCYVWDLVSVMYGLCFVLCAGFSLFHVPALARVMCRRWSAI